MPSAVRVPDRAPAARNAGEPVSDEVTEPSDEEVVRAATEAAENVVFSRFDRAEVRDLDLTIRFEEGRLDVDVYLEADDERRTSRVADDAALAARGAVDDLFAAADDADGDW